MFDFSKGPFCVLLILCYTDLGYGLSCLRCKSIDVLSNCREGTRPKKHTPFIEKCYGRKASCYATAIVSQEGEARFERGCSKFGICKENDEDLEFCYTCRHTNCNFVVMELDEEVEDYLIGKEQNTEQYNDARGAVASNITNSGPDQNTEQYDDARGAAVSKTTNLGTYQNTEQYFASRSAEGSKITNLGTDQNTKQYDDARGAKGSKITNLGIDENAKKFDDTRGTESSKINNSGIDRNTEQRGAESSKVTNLGIDQNTKVYDDVRSAEGSKVTNNPDEGTTIKKTESTAD